MKGNRYWKYESKHPHPKQINEIELKAILRLLWSPDNYVAFKQTLQFKKNCAKLSIISDYFAMDETLYP